jgi:hypothetical protein
MSPSRLRKNSGRGSSQHSLLRILVQTLGAADDVPNN